MRSLPQLFGLSLLALACGSESSTYPPGPGGASSEGMGGAGADTGGQLPGLGGSPGGGGPAVGGAGGTGGVVTTSGGSPAGGSPPAGGVGGTAGGGVTGGAGGGVTGGTAGGVTGGSGGVATGGAGGGVTGGSGGGVTGGTGGGATGGMGGGATGGTAGSGGAGGDATGGTAGTGGQQQTNEPFVITSGENAYWQEGQLTEVTGSADVTVNANTTHQTWHGFGGTFNEKGWVALQALSASDRDRAIRLLFDVQDGIGFTWGRIPMGASDYAVQRYSLNESSGDYAMNNFSIDHDRDASRGLIPYIKAAQAVKGDIRFWATPWTPPTWMKTNAVSADGFDGGVMRNEQQVLEAHALYFARFIQAYEGEGIPIEAIMPQNEPGYTQNYPSCGWGKYRTPDNQNVDGQIFLGSFIRDYLVPTLNSEGLSTDIWFGTLSNDVFAQDYWNDARSAAPNDIVGVGLQWNNVGLVQSIANGGYLVMQSEHQCGNYPWLSARATSPADANRDNFLPDMAPNNHAYGEESWDLITNWIEGGVHVYSAWNMVLDTVGMNLDQTREWPQNALLAVDLQARTLQVTPAYYVFRHCAQYVAPGATRIGTSGGDALAFRNTDGSIVTIMYNSGGSRQTTVAVGGATLQFSIPGRGWATVYWPSA
jgi:glucosylceramidase